MTYMVEKYQTNAVVCRIKRFTLIFVRLKNKITRIFSSFGRLVK
jgi:hypothetical protein